MKCTHVASFENIEEFACRVAKTIEAAEELVEAGLEYVTDMEDSKLFRKRT